MLFFNAVVVHAQPVNLVPNGGFEERDLCIFNDSYIEDCYPWFNPMDLSYPNWATPDLFHDCAVVNDAPCPFPEDVNTNAWFFGVPTNALGCEDPYEGDGYAGAFFFIPNIEDQLDGYREYLAVRLTEPMQAGAVYDVSMQVSLAERTTHAIWNVQVLFSADSLSQPTTEYMDYEPQLSGTPGDYIDNKDGWRELEWEYTAEGGEEFMYIGNFQPGSETDTLFVHEGSTIGSYLHATYYYIDDVRVLANPLNTLASIKDHVNIFPNPATDVISISAIEDLECTIELFDISGRLMKSTIKEANGSSAMDISELVSGMYTVRITEKNGTRFSKKLIKR